MIVLNGNYTSVDMKTKTIIEIKLVTDIFMKNWKLQEI